jgi:uncharacterized protein affecting Mg2+/Co2+ transport
MGVAGAAVSNNTILLTGAGLMAGAISMALENGFRFKVQN